MLEESFKDRINILYRDLGISASAMARIAGLSSASLNFYLNGERRPDATALAKLCKAFNVSADWLLGLSDVRSISADIQTACKTLGLSETAAQNIQKINCEWFPKEDPKQGILSQLFEIDIDAWFHIVDYLERCFEVLNHIEPYFTDSTPLQNTYDSNMVVLNPVKAATYFGRLADDNFSTMLDTEIAHRIIKITDEIKEKRNESNG